MSDNENGFSVNQHYLDVKKTNYLGCLEAPMVILNCAAAEI